MKRTCLFCLIAVLFAFCLTACVTRETQRVVPAEQTRASMTFYSGPRAPIVVGSFDNRSNFMRGIFSDGQDRLGNQAKTILITHLQQTNRFTVLDRDNMEEAMREAEIRGEVQNLMGASYIITGGVTEFGRREVGDHQLWGILGRGRSQVAYAKVSLNVVDIRTSAVVSSAQGGNEVRLSEREILGFGTSAGYDSTLNGKVLDGAIREAIDELINAIERGLWRPAI